MLQLYGEDLKRNWSLAKVTELISSSDSLVRWVNLLIGDEQLGDDGRRHMKQKLIEIPIHKLILVLESPH